MSGKLLLSQRAALVSRMADLEQGAQVFQVPPVSAATLGVFGAYFLGGFFLYSGIFAAVGATCSNEQEARQAQVPVMLLLMAALLGMFPMLANPGSTFAVTLSLVPFTAPIAMPVRWAAGSLPAGELAGSLGLLVVAIGGVTWIAARIYRVGILMTGKRPNVREVIRWVRAA